MNVQRIGTIQKHSGSQNKVFLGPEFTSSLPSGETITLQYGQQKAQAVVAPLKGNGLIALSNNLWEKLAIPFSHKLHIEVGEKKIKLGPLVGIMTTGIFPHSMFPVGRRTGFFKRYLLSQKDVPCSYFLFSPLDVSPEEKRVYGYFIRKKQGMIKWERHPIPFPDVIYNRVFRKSEKTKKFIKTKSLLEQAGIKIFNPFCFNKWDIHQRIKHVDEVQPYIPETIIDPNTEQITMMLKKYKMVYLKPVEGFMGLGIVKLKLQANRSVVCQYNTKNKNQEKNFSSLTKAIHYLFRGKKLSRYIAQQGIKLIESDGRSIDFRVHTNRDRYGQWQMTGAAAKMAGKGSVTTHMRTGGQVFSYKEVIQKAFPGERYRQVLNKLDSAVLSLSKAIEGNLPNYVGDIGFDIGIDQSGQPWMFEANSQPGRHIFAEPHLKKSEVVTRQRILDYALYLANFSPKDVS
jgi:hypothetical protein